MLITEKEQKSKVNIENDANALIISARQEEMYSSYA